MPRTETGRIVYDRRPHLFTYKDVNRIVRVVESRRLSDVPDILFTIVRACEDLYGLGDAALRRAAAGGVLPAVAPAIVFTLFKVALGLIATMGESALDTLRDLAVEPLQEIVARFFGDLFGPAADELAPVEAPLEEGEDNG